MPSPIESCLGSIARPSSAAAFGEVALGNFLIARNSEAADRRALCQADCCRRLRVWANAVAGALVSVAAAATSLPLCKDPILEWEVYRFRGTC